MGEFFTEDEEMKMAIGKTVKMPVVNDWEKEWKEMPEYNNVNLPEPVITVVFKFRKKEDFDKFHEVIKAQLYDNKRVFDGKQDKNKKNTWYPLDRKAGKYKYV